MVQKTSCWAVSFLLVMTSMSIRAEQPLSVAVFQIEPRGAALSQQLLEKLSTDLGRQVAARMQVQLIDWKKVLGYLRTQDLYHCIDRNCQMDVEKALHADYSLVVKVLPLGRICALSATLYPTQSPASLRTAMFRGSCTNRSFREGISSLSKDLAASGPLPKPSLPAPNSQAKENDRSRQVKSEPEQPLQYTHVLDEADQQELTPATLRRSVLSRRREYSPFLLGVGLVYAPAPIVLFDHWDQRRWTKKPDDVGIQLAFEWHFRDHLMVGGQVNFLSATDSAVLEGGGRFGVEFPLHKKLSIAGHAFSNLMFMQRELPDFTKQYWGAQIGISLGLRYFVRPWVGFNLGAACAASQLLRHEKDRIIQGRFQLLLGVLLAL